MDFLGIRRTQDSSSKYFLLRINAQCASPAKITDGRSKLVLDSIRKSLLLSNLLNGLFSSTYKMVNYDHSESPLVMYRRVVLQVHYVVLNATSRLNYDKTKINLSKSIGSNFFYHYNSITVLCFLDIIEMARYCCDAIDRCRQ